MMVGRDVDDLYPRSRARRARSCSRWTTSPAAATSRRSATLQLRRGEVLGIAGLIGAGRTELLRAIFGLRPVRQGHVRVAAYSGTASPRGRWRQGHGHGQRRPQGRGPRARTSRIADNLTLSKLRLLRLARGSRSCASQHLDRPPRHPLPLAAAAGRRLSGGNQQKVAIARLLHHDVDVLLLDEPTRGIDVGIQGADLPHDRRARAQRESRPDGQQLSAGAARHLRPHRRHVPRRARPGAAGRRGGRAPDHARSDRRRRGTPLRHAASSTAAPTSTAPDASPERAAATPTGGRTSPQVGPLIGLHLRLAKLTSAHRPGASSIVALSPRCATRRSSTVGNFELILRQTAVVGIAALGMTLIIIAGGIDLSVGSAIALVCVTIALFMPHEITDLGTVPGRSRRKLPPALAALRRDRRRHDRRRRASSRLRAAPHRRFCVPSRLGTRRLVCGKPKGW